MTALPREPDSLSALGATRLAVRLRDYWTNQGCPVTAWIEAEKMNLAGGHQFVSIYGVRSDLVAGLPRAAQ